MRRRARDAPAAEAADNVEQSFQDEALIPAPQHRERVAVVEECCLRVYLFRRDFINKFLGLILCYFDC